MLGTLLIVQGAMERVEPGLMSTRYSLLTRLPLVTRAYEGGLTPVRGIVIATRKEQE